MNRLKSSLVKGFIEAVGRNPLRRNQRRWTLRQEAHPNFGLLFWSFDLRAKHTPVNSSSRGLVVVFYTTGAYSPRFGCANGIKPENRGGATFECTEPVHNESHRSQIEQPFCRRLMQRIRKDISADPYLSPGRS